MKRSLFYLLAGASAILAPAAHAASPVEILVSDAGQRDPDGKVTVEVRLLNGGTEPQTIALPDRIEARLTANGAHRIIWLERTAGTPPDVTIAPEAFRRASYRFVEADRGALDGTQLSIPAWSA